ncbi:MAG: hypothetical protein ACNA7E_09055, partial [Wenzhouxiangellaceae bacterium]
MNEIDRQFANQQLVGEYREATRDRNHHAACPPGDQLSRLAGGWLWPWQRRQLTRHLSHCSSCSADLQAVMKVREDLAAALGTHNEQAAPAFLRPALAGLAVAVTLGLAVSLVSLPGHGPTPDHGGSMAAFTTDSGNGDADRIFTSDFGESQR